MIRNFVKLAGRQNMLKRGIGAGFDHTKNYYQEMEVQENATAADIKKAYVKLVKKYHPDQNKGMRC